MYEENKNENQKVLYESKLTDRQKERLEKKALKNERKENNPILIKIMNFSSVG